MCVQVSLLNTDLSPSEIPFTVGTYREQQGCGHQGPIAGVNGSGQVEGWVKMCGSIPSRSQHSGLFI